MLDNGYVYLAATRLSLFRSAEDWAMVIEIFGFSPRAGLPDTNIYTFASRLWNRDGLDKYVSDEAYRNYLTNHPHNESRFVFPVEEGSWQDEEDSETIAENASTVVVRGRALPVPARHEYATHGIELEEAGRVRVFELCRYLAAVDREAVLATPDERRVSVRPEMVQLLQLEEWNHPNIVDESEHPGNSPVFQQLARVLETGDVSAYRPSPSPNTHWSNWPDGGTL
jgi:hypothetical protein